MVFFFIFIKVTLYVTTDEKYAEAANLIDYCS